MKTSTAADERRRKIGGACLLAAPLIMLAGDSMRAAAALHYEFLVTLKLSFAVFVAAILALVHLLRDGADRTGLAGGALALAGCVAGSGILTAEMVNVSLESAALGEPALRVVEDALRKGGVASFLFLFPLPGLAFPVGLLVLSFGLLRARAAPTPAALLLALGAALFPVGRIGGIEPVILASSAALSVSMGWIGWRVLNRAATVGQQADASEALAEELTA